MRLTKPRLRLRSGVSLSDGKGGPTMLILFGDPSLPAPVPGSPGYVSVDYTFGKVPEDFPGLEYL